MKTTPETVVLVNCGCTDIQKLARAVRARHVYTMVMPCTASAERILAEKPVGLIFVSDGDEAAVKAKAAAFDAIALPKLYLANAALQPAVTADKAGNFCFEQCNCTGAWRLDRFIEEAVADIREQVGDGHVVLGLSGGVDSSVVAALIHRAIGDRLSCVFVNHGLLRKNEAEMVQDIFARNFKMNLVYVDASDRFLDKLDGVSDPEQKRKIIGKEFIDVFAEAAAATNAPFLGQGTI
jgi:GMP synthase (glutamine-hydrolysing)